MDRSLGVAVPALVAYVAISSFLGLTGRIVLFEPDGALEFMVEVWSLSVLADLVFVVGSVLAAVFAFRMAKDSALVVAVLTGWFASWLVYFASFLLLPREDYDLDSQGLLESFWFVVAWGFPGLVFASLAPPLAQRWILRRGR